MGGVSESHGVATRGTGEQPPLSSTCDGPEATGLELLDLFFVGSLPFFKCRHTSLKHYASAEQRILEVHMYEDWFEASSLEL